MSGRRHGLRKQVKEAKEGSLKLRKEKGKGNVPWREREGEREGLGPPRKGF